jgi:PAS domain S-box-containing protein
MNLYSVIPLTSFIVHCLLIAYIVALDTRHKANRAFIYMAAFFALWGLGSAISWNCESLEVARIVERIHVPFWLFSSFVGLNFVYVMIHRKRGIVFFTLFGLNAAFGIIGVATDHIVVDVVRMSWGVNIVYGPLYLPSVLLANTTAALWGFYLLVRTIITTGDAMIRKQLVCFFAGTVIMYSVVFGYNVVYRVVFHNVSVPSIGSFLLLIQTGFVFYAIRRFSFLRLGISGVANELAKQMHEGVIIIDPNNCIVDLNSMARSFLGIGNRHVIGQPVADFMPLSYSPERVYTNKDVYLQRDGSERIGLLSQSELYNAGIKVGKMCMIRDITKVRQQAREQEKVKEELKQSEQTKMEAIGRLAGGIAHDFNNMLGAVCGYADLIKRKTHETDPLLYKYANNIVSASRRSSDLTEKLLAFARQGRAETVYLDLHETVEEACILITHSIDKRIHIKKNLDATQRIVQGDRTQLQNVILNLAINAKDALPHGGTIELSTYNVSYEDQEIRDNISTAQAASYVALVVSDNGVGMSEETKQHVFEPFFTTKEPGKGTGLGLASVFGTVKSHRGTITLDSSPNTGTTFTIYLPVQKEGLLERKSDADTAEPVGAPDGTGKILLVDDEEMVRDSCAVMLQDLGYEVVSCADGMQALEYYRSGHNEVAAVILDLNMPRMHGWDCLTGLKQINPHVKVCISSGYTQQKYKGRDSGAVFLQKPFTQEMLAETLEKLLRKTSDTTAQPQQPSQDAPPD